MNAVTHFDFKSSSVRIVLDDNGEPMYSLEDIAKHFGISFEEAEQQLLRMMNNRQQVGLSTDGIIANPDFKLNRIQWDYKNESR